MVSTSVPADRVLPGIVATAAAHEMRLERAMTVEAALFGSIRHRLLPLWLYGGLALVGLVVLVAGVVGLVAMTTVHRTREIGIRLALGSTPGAVSRLLVREQLLAALGGIAAGGVVAALTVGALRSQLYEISPHSSDVWLAGAIVVAAVTAVGAFIPARLAANVDPMRTLRVD
jgi:ABC-type antimicrobial peptide transport system permease subunit